jgi:hypothetical protein
MLLLLQARALPATRLISWAERFVSTINNIDKRAKIAKGRRREALAFFRAQCSGPGFLGVAARAVYEDLLKVHRDPARNGPEKEREFKRIIQSARLDDAGAPAGANDPAGPAAGDSNIVPEA